MFRKFRSSLCVVFLGLTVAGCQTTPVILSSPDAPNTPLTHQVVTDFYLSTYVEFESDTRKDFDAEGISEVTTISRRLDMRRHPVETLERTEYNFPCTGGPEDRLTFLCTLKPEAPLSLASGSGCALPKPEGRYSAPAFSCKDGARHFDVYRIGYDCDPPGEALRVLERDREELPLAAQLIGENAELIRKEEGDDEVSVHAGERMYFISRARQMEFGAALPEPELSSLLSTPPGHDALKGARPVAFRLDLRGMPIATPETPPSVRTLSSAAKFCNGGDAVVSTVHEAAGKVDRQLAYTDGEKTRSYGWYGLDMTGVPETLFGTASRDAKDMSINVIDAATGEGLARAPVVIEGIADALFTYSYFEKTYLKGAEDAFVRNLYRSLKGADLFRFTTPKSQYANGDIIRVQNHRALRMTVRVARKGYYPVNAELSVPLPATSLTARLVPLPQNDAPEPEFKGEIIVQ